MNWLDAQAEGIAFMLSVLAGTAVMLLVAWAIERWNRAMRRHERLHAHLTAANRAREQLRRELDDSDLRERLRLAADLIVQNGWKGPEGRV